MDGSVYISMMEVLLIRWDNFLLLIAKSISQIPNETPTKTLSPLLLLLHRSPRRGPPKRNFLFPSGPQEEALQNAIGQAVQQLVPAMMKACNAGSPSQTGVGQECWSKIWSSVGCLAGMRVGNFWGLLDVWQVVLVSPSPVKWVYQIVIKSRTLERPAPEL